MSANKCALPLFLAGLALSTALAQNSSTQPSARPQTLAQATEPAQPSTAPRARTAGTASVPGSGVPIGTVPGRRPSTAPGKTSTTRREPCWQVAGVSKSAMQQRRVIAQQARQEVESVCANSSLSVQQKRERIREIHQRERQQVEALITPQQQAAMRACQEQRGGGHSSGGGHLGGGHGAGPCGTMPGFQERENATEPNETPPQN
jgi:hypothetical protein